MARYKIESLTRPNFPKGESPITRRDRFSAPGRAGWEVEALQNNNIRDRFLPAELALYHELPIIIHENDGRLSYTPDKNRTTKPEQFTMGTLQSINRDPFARVDAIGTPEIVRVSPATKGEKFATKVHDAVDKAIRVRAITLYVRDAMRAVYKPDVRPRQKGWIAFFASFIPASSHIQDLSAVADISSLTGHIPGLR